MSEVKEWVKVVHAAGRTNVTVTLVDGNLTARWSVKCYASTIKQGVAEARAAAEKALQELREAVAA